MGDLLQKNIEHAPKAPTATHFVTKNMFKNEGVNQGSNFPGPTPKTKVAPNPIFRENILLTFF